MPKKKPSKTMVYIPKANKWFKLKKSYTQATLDLIDVLYDKYGDIDAVYDNIFYDEDAKDYVMEVKNILEKENKNEQRRITK